MRYAEAIAHLYGYAPRGISLGLTRMQKTLALRGSPQHAFESIVVAGTNGKGSVATSLASVLGTAGLRVGLYTSPHLHRLVERFRVNGRAMTSTELTRRVRELAPFLTARGTPRLTFFEVCTLLAFEWFRDLRCDMVVLEVGLGGRLDATNVVTPRLSVITRVALDHTDRLGSTLAQIAREKAGVIKPGVPVVVGVREPEALRVIERTARRRRAPLLRIGREFSVTAEARAGGDARLVTKPRFAFEMAGRSRAGLRLPLPGAYQADNLACTVAALGVLEQQGIALRDEVLRRGLRKVRWPGRLELLPGAPDLLLDAAHNPDACVELARYVAELRARYRRCVLLFGALQDKDYVRMLALLTPHFDRVVFSTPDSVRALHATTLGQALAGEVIDSPQRALKRAQKLAGKRGLVVVAGSMVLMSQVRALRLGVREDPKIAL